VQRAADWPTDCAFDTQLDVAAQSGNRLFDALGSAARARLHAHVDLVRLSTGQALYGLGGALRYAYFPLDGMISLLASTADGDVLEVATVGDDGFVGVPIVLNVPTSPYDVIVQVSCAAHRVRADAVAREFQRGEDLHAVVLAYAHDLMQQLLTSSVCHTFHSLMQRLCRWLLIHRQGLRANTIDVTQEAIAHVLGASRPKVSQALVILEERHLIHQGHGRIHIVDRHGLARSSCACYPGTRDHQQPQPIRHAR
jgi:CRP-like cAMP-binding protein